MFRSAAARHSCGMDEPGSRPSGRGVPETSRSAEQVGQPANLVVRAAQPADCATVARIWRDGWVDAHAGHVSSELVSARDPATFLTRSADRLAAMLVGAVGDRVAGFVVTVGDELEQLYVDRAWRGVGVAAALLAAGQEPITAEGHPQAWLAVVEQNQRARAFYAKAGWRDSGPFSYLAEAPGGGVRVPCRRYVVDLPAPDL